MSHWPVQGKFYEKVGNVERRNNQNRGQMFEKKKTKKIVRNFLYKRKTML